MGNSKYYLCVTPFFPSSDNWRGAYVYDQVKAIQRHSEYKVVVFKTNTLIDKEEDYDIDGIHVYSIRPFLMPSYILNGLTEKIVGTLFVRKLKQVGINPVEVAFVHCHTTNHAAFGFGVKQVNPKVKVLVQFHDLDPLTLRNGKWADKRWNLRYRAQKSIEALNKADLLVCISEPVRDVLLSFPKPRIAEVYPPALSMYNRLGNMPHVVPKKLYVLNNGVDVEYFNAGIMRRRTDCDIYRIGCVANFQDLKDHKTLLAAFSELIKRGYLDMRLSLLGSGETKGAIIQYVKDNKLNDYVEWEDEIPHQKLPDYYRSLDLFVLPSRFEGFGCVYTEAAACGVPFICCENQGAAECISVSERSRWLTKDHDASHLCSLIERQYKERTCQHLCKPYDINELIRNFLLFLKGI